jgi:hypothetical protein
MKKISKLFALLLMFVFCASCGQNQTNVPKENSKSETKDVSTFGGIDTKYEYTDSNGKSLIIQNSLPKGESYTDPNGKKYFKVIFWTRIINETSNPLELEIDFPVDLYEVAGLPGKYYKVLVPPDTMTIDKEPLNNYGLTGLKSFLDNSIHKRPSSLKRNINPKESSGFYVVILFDNGVAGPFRTALSVKGQDLFYTLNGKEIYCGKINLKNLMLQQ